MCFFFKVVTPPVSRSNVLREGLAPKMFLRECLDWRSASAAFKSALKGKNL